MFTVADGLLWLFQSTERNSIVRKMQIMKLRGQESVPGLHTFRITHDGLQTFPRTFGLAQESGHVKGTHRVSTGIPTLDGLMDGGIPDGSSLLLAGPSGSGKSILASQFIAEGLRNGEPGVVAILKSFRPNSPAGQLNSVSTSTRHRKTARSRSSTSARWTFRSMRPSMPSSTR